MSTATAAITAAATSTMGASGPAASVSVSPAGLAGTLRDRLPGETTFDALRRWIDAMFDQWTAEEDEALLRKRLCREDEGLANFHGGIMARIHELLLEAIADDLDEPQDALRTQLVAGAAIAALTSLEVTLHVQAEQRGPAAKAQGLAVLDDAVLSLRGGLDALQSK